MKVICKYKFTKAKFTMMVDLNYFLYNITSQLKYELKHEL